MLKHSICVLLVIVFSGCTSFRTTVLQRFSNDSVKPQKTNQKLKGLPVKLKVPSHLLVTIYEEQVILANGDPDLAKLADAAAGAAAEVQLIDAQIAKLDTDVAESQAQVDKLSSIITAVLAQIEAIEPNPDDVSKQTVKTLQEELKNTRTLLAKAFTANREALGRQSTKPKLIADKEEAIAAAKVAAANSAIGYTLISFTPAQFHVESELQYTDKIFLVDFKRPAGGILNLTGASMDEEQYFSDVQAEVTERTLSDIGDALTTVGGAVTKPKPTAATPVSSETPAADGNNTVNFQQSVIASKRFDISESGWEQNMRDFVNGHLGRSDLIGETPSLAPALYEHTERIIYEGQHAPEHLESERVFTDGNLGSTSNYFQQ